MRLQVRGVFFLELLQGFRQAKYRLNETRRELRVINSLMINVVVTTLRLVASRNIGRRGYARKASSVNGSRDSIGGR